MPARCAPLMFHHDRDKRGRSASRAARPAASVAAGAASSAASSLDRSSKCRSSLRISDTSTTNTSALPGDQPQPRPGEQQPWDVAVYIRTSSNPHHDLLDRRVEYGSTTALEARARCNSRSPKLSLSAYRLQTTVHPVAASSATFQAQSPAEDFDVDDRPPISRQFDSIYVNIDNSLVQHPFHLSHSFVCRSTCPWAPIAGGSLVNASIRRYSDRYIRRRSGPRKAGAGEVGDHAGPFGPSIDPGDHRVGTLGVVDTMSAVAVAHR